MGVSVRMPPVVTASRWTTAYSALWDVALKRNRNAVDDDGVSAPVISNAEVITLVMGWMAAATPQRFPLWYQFAAAAYRWDPSLDALDISTAQGKRDAPAYLRVALWTALLSLARELDADGVTNPRIDLDGRFDDPVFQGEVGAALQSDGAQAQFKIPLPACRGKDGKYYPPRLQCAAGTTPRMISGVLVCEAPDGKITKPRLRCPDPLVIDDPITGGAKRGLGSLLTLAIVVLLAASLVEDAPRLARG